MQLQKPRVLFKHTCPLQWTGSVGRGRETKVSNSIFLSAPPPPPLKGGGEGDIFQANLWILGRVEEKSILCVVKGVTISPFQCQAWVPISGRQWAGREKLRGESWSSRSLQSFFFFFFFFFFIMKGWAFFTIGCFINFFP